MSDMPQGPLKDHVCLIRTEKLSPFQQPSITSNNPFNCTHVLCQYPTRDQQRNFSQKQSNSYMGQDDIPSVFSYLRANGYSIDTELTSTYKSRITGSYSKVIIAIVSMAINWPRSWTKADWYHWRIKSALKCGFFFKGLPVYRYENGTMCHFKSSNGRNQQLQQV